jgi:hypothetical protein
MMLETNSIIVILVIGLVAGWLAGKIMGGGFGIIGDNRRLYRHLAVGCAPSADDREFLDQRDRHLDRRRLHSSVHHPPDQTIAAARGFAHG